jgi:hypothetical protein
MVKDYYALLGLTSSASSKEIRRAYYKLAREYHPDISSADNSAELFKQINEAYQVLSNSEKRSSYDLSLKFGFEYIKVDFEPYLHAEISDKSVKLNEEFIIKFSYAGEGRVFQKPDVASLVYSSSPVVEHRLIPLSNGSVRETILSFTVCALTTGILKIPSATIYINHNLYKSPPLEIAVLENKCYFKMGESASINPLPVYLNKEHVSNTSWKRTYIYRHVVLIPRSAYAHYYHRIGATLKIVFGFLGIVWSVNQDYWLLLGICAGSFAGGIICYSMYILSGVKPRYYFSLQHTSVKSYMEEGYRPGRDPAYGIFADRYFYLFLRLFI